MKKLFRYVALFLVLFPLIMICTSCVKETDNYKRSNLVYYTADEGSFFVKLIEKYNKYCQRELDESYQIEIVRYDSEREMNIIISTEIMAGAGPDIITLDQGIPFEKLMETNAFANIDELLEHYEYEIDFSELNSQIMGCGMYEGRRYIIPIFYSPNIFFTTQEIIDKYELNTDTMFFEGLSSINSNTNYDYSLFGSRIENTRLMYYFINQYVDFREKTTDFESDEFLHSLEYIKKLLDGDKTNDAIFYDLAENNNCLFSTARNMFGGNIKSILSGYSYISTNNKTPIIVQNYNKLKNGCLAYVQCGFAVNDNSQNKEKVLAFIDYVLSEDVQGYWCGVDSDSTHFSGTNVIALPVNNNVLDCAIEEVSDTYDNARYIEDYLEFVKKINGCTIYNYERIENTYYNSSVIGDIVDDYLNGVVTTDKFVQRLTAATEIYLTE